MNKKPKKFRFVTDLGVTIGCFYSVEEGVSYCLEMAKKYNTDWVVRYHPIKQQEWKCDALFRNQEVNLKEHL